MRIGLLALSAATALAAATAGAADAGRCDARAGAEWRAGGNAFTIEATSSGPDCARAVATIVIRNARDAPVYAETHFTGHVMTLAYAETAKAMQEALADWIDASRPAFESSAALPDWPEGAEGPEEGEFPFYVAEGFDRELYLALRRRAAPVYCYVQGMESLHCLAEEDGALTSIGVQLFPG